jgi:hypothetical protein
MDNRERLIQIAEETFNMRNDPDQLSVDEEVRARLIAIDPATLNEFSVKEGPVVWVLVIPTTTELMTRFIKGEINEKKLFRLTPVGISYDTIYLCSALVLPEYRRKGYAGQLTLNAIHSIRLRHPIKSLFVWPFSEGGDILASVVAEAVGLPLLRRMV